MSRVPLSSSDTRLVYLYHVSPAVNAESIFERGLLANFAGRVYFVSPGRLAWAVEHVADRHHTRQLMIVRVGVPRWWLRRYTARLRWGCWYAGRDVPAARFSGFGVSFYEVSAGAVEIARRELSFTGDRRLSAWSAACPDGGLHV